MTLKATAAAAAIFGWLWHAPATAADDNTLNIYSARHYQSDEALYDDFSRKTGIRIQRIEADDNTILERLRNEGAKSPADVVLIVDAARLWRAEAEGLFQPVRSAVLEARIPANLRGADGGQGAHWFGISTRARMIVFNKVSVRRDDVLTYESLADPKLRGKVCTRSGSHPYMLSMIGAILEHHGPAATERWAQGMVANFARPPRGGDTDQIKSVASGECGVALTNSYYYARLLRSTKAEDRDAINKVGFVWPNQSSTGTHVNIAGAGIAKHAPHRDAAIRFMEYLASDEAQAYFADGNNEWPVVASVASRSAGLKAMGPFKAESLPIAAIGRNQATVQKILDRAGYP